MHRVVVIMVVIGVIASAAGAAAGPVFVDPSGDARSGPDITRVGVTSDAAAVVFRIQTAQAASWQEAAAILALDTGPAQGVELTYVLHSQHDHFTLDRADGTHVDHPGATWQLVGPVLTIRVPRDELQAAGRVTFTVKTPAPDGGDTAPNTGAWSLIPGAAVASLSAAFAPRAPVHGRAFAVSALRVTFSDGTTGTAAPSCRWRLGAAAPRTGCKLRLPASARGKALTLTLTAVGASRVYRFRVR